SVFVADAGIKDVSVAIQPDALFTTVDSATTHVAFASPGEKMGVLHLKAANRLRNSRRRFTPSAAAHRASSGIFICVRTSAAPAAKFQSAVLAAGESWSATVAPFGVAGTHTATLEVSAIPPMDLDGRFSYLIQYPHGCLEQTTSSAFPQLYLPAL